MHQFLNFLRKRECVRASDLEKSDKEYDLFTDPVQVCVVS